MTAWLGSCTRRSPQTPLQVPIWTPPVNHVVNPVAIRGETLGRRQKTLGSRKKVLSRTSSMAEIVQITSNNPSITRDMYPPTKIEYGRPQNPTPTYMLTTLYVAKRLVCFTCESLAADNAEFV
mmetsp:Transcript_12000/g.19085  ORF Transcript_12000/g.19085 Transcript_12000/m.19085 type:complete len:123 (-) Transcript_12000:348-716(-)